MAFFEEDNIEEIEAAEDKYQPAERTCVDTINYPIEDEEQDIDVALFTAYW